MKKLCLLRRTFFLAGLASAFFSFFIFESIYAQTLEFERIRELRIPSRFNPVGSGARALGMGNAFIAVADDATAASWNPAGLIQLDRPEFSVVGDYFYRTDDLDFGNNPEANGSQSVSETKLNFISAAYPFTLFNRNMIVSLNYQRRFDFNLDWEYTRNVSSPRLTETQRIKNHQDGEIYALGIAYSIKLLKRLSFGFTLNLWENLLEDNKWEVKTVQDTSGNFKLPGGIQESFLDKSILDEEFKFSGINFNLGILWNVTDKLNLGFVFKSPFTADLKARTKFMKRQEFSDFTLEDETVFKDDLDLDMPMSYGAGIAYRASDQFLISADFTRTHWEDFLLKNGDEISPITTLPKNESDIDPTNTIRVGGEYVFIRPKFVVPLRGGVFYDPAPARNSPDNFYGFSIGTGIGMKRFSFDVAYQYRFGRNVGGSKPTESDLSVDVDEHSVYSSLILYF